MHEYPLLNGKQWSLLLTRDTTWFHRLGEPHVTRQNEITGFYPCEFYMCIFSITYDCTLIYKKKESKTKKNFKQVLIWVLHRELTQKPHSKSEKKNQANFFSKCQVFRKGFIVGTKKNKQFVYNMKFFCIFFTHSGTNKWNKNKNFNFKN